LRRLSLGVLGIVCLLVLSSGSALAAKDAGTRFRVSFTATLTKTWNVTSSEGEPGCVRTTKSSGRWQARLAAKRASRVRVVSLGRGRVRFAGTIDALAGTASQSGTNVLIGQGSPQCDRQTRTVRCATQRRSFRRASTALRNPRRGVLSPAGLKGAAAVRSFSPQCPEEPPEVRSIRTDLPLAAGPLDAADFSNRDIPNFFVTGDSQQETRITGDLEGTVVERVRWRVTFTRIA
jgi:hypothetical protein